VFKAGQKHSDARRRAKSGGMRRTTRYIAMIPIAIGNERNAADVVPAQAGISVFQQPANSFLGIA